MSPPAPSAGKRGRNRCDRVHRPWVPARFANAASTVDRFWFRAFDPRSVRPARLGKGLAAPAALRERSREGVAGRAAAASLPGVRRAGGWLVCAVSRGPRVSRGNGLSSVRRAGFTGGDLSRRPPTSAAPGPGRCAVPLPRHGWQARAAIQARRARRRRSLARPGYGRCLA